MPPLRRRTLLVVYDGFPPSRDFYVRTHVNFTRLNEIEAMYGKTRVNS